MTTLYAAYGPGSNSYGVPDGTTLDCGHEATHTRLDHRYTPNAATLADPERARTDYLHHAVCECGAGFADHDFGTGYAATADKRMICYRCAEADEAKDFAAAAIYTAYHVEKRPTGWDAAAGTIQTWTGKELARVTAAWESHAHPTGGTMRHIQAKAPDGSRWYGRYMPDWTEAVTLHRVKGA